MARTGRFGRLPRAAPNLASIIVSMAREIEAMEDANLIEAWENGGTVDGKKVTDQMILNHFKARRDSVSKTDPLWDQWNIQLQNYTFAIEESKMSLRYDQGKVNETQMANFYTKWAKTMDPNSEGYRELMRAAARFIDAAKARSGGGGGGSRGGGTGGVEANAALMAAYERYEKPWQIANAAVMEAAVRTGILQEHIDADPDDLFDLRSGTEMDHLQFMQLFDAIQNNPEFADIKQMLDDSGIGALTYDQFVGLSNDSITGLRQQADIALAAGDEEMYDDIMEDAAERVQMAGVAGDIDEYAEYQESTAILNQRIASGNLNQFELAALMDTYVNQINGLRTRPGVSNQTMGYLNQELNMLLNPGGPSGPGLGTGTAESDSGESTTPEPAQELGTLWADAMSDVEAVTSGQAMLYSHPVTGWDIINYGDPLLGDPNSGTVLPTKAGTGISVPTFVAHVPIMVSAAANPDATTGRPVDEPVTSDRLVGYMLNFGGRTMYGILQPGSGGQLVWYNSAPWRQGAFQSQINENGEIEVNVTLEEGTAPHQAVRLADDSLEFTAYGAVMDTRAAAFELPYTGRALGDGVTGERNVPMSALLAMAVFNPVWARTDLVHATPDQLWESLLQANGGDINLANNEWDAMSRLRDPLAAGLNREITAGSIEYQRLNMIDGYEPPDTIAMLTQTSPQEQERQRLNMASASQWEQERMATASRLSDEQMEENRRRAIARKFVNDPVAGARRMGLEVTAADSPWSSIPGGPPVMRVPDLPPEWQRYVDQARREQEAAQRRGMVSPVTGQPFGPEGRSRAGTTGGYEGRPAQPRTPVAPAPVPSRETSRSRIERPGATTARPRPAPPPVRPGVDDNPALRVPKLQRPPNKSYSLKRPGTNALNPFGLN